MANNDRKIDYFFGTFTTSSPYIQSRVARCLRSEAVTVASTQASSFVQAVNRYLNPPVKPPETLFESVSAAASKFFHEVQTALQSSRGAVGNEDQNSVIAAINHVFRRLSQPSSHNADQIDTNSDTVVNRYLTSLNAFDPATLVPTLLAVFLASFLISRPSTMSSWRGWTSDLAGRLSPFTRSPATGGEVTDAAFSYITDDDLKRNNIERSHGDGVADGRDGEATHRDHHHHHRHSRGSSKEDLSTRDTDVLVLKIKSHAYQVHFPAMSIDRGELRVGDIRAAAAKKVGGTASGIKMFYKGRNLKEDSRQARDEGLSSGRQNELLCVVGDGPPPQQDDEDDDEEDEEVDDSAAGDSSGKKKKRKNRKKKSRRSDQNGGAAAGSSYTGSGPSAPSTFIPPSHIPTPTSRSAASTPAPASNTPQTPVDKVRALVSKFDTEFLPLCEAYVSRPPTDKAKRDFEHKKLTETIMGQILLKLDGVEPEGDPEARMKRKEAVKEVNGWLSKLDKVVAA